jgi:acyl-CoA reductase-like NAD-dependent aldehyde dehydrogenase
MAVLFTSAMALKSNASVQAAAKPGLLAAYPYYLANRPVHANTALAVTNKYTGEVATRVAQADRSAIEQGIAAAASAFEQFRRWPAFKRRAVLAHVVERLRARHEHIAVAVSIEAGKPIRDARSEITRAIDTFTIAMEESVRMHGELRDLEISERAAGYRGFVKRVPIGPCSFITPWNFPLNLVAHKVAPALAVGRTFVLKPASRTPLGALMLGEILAETDLPVGTFSVLPCARDGADPFTTDERLKLLSFTGSPEVGWELKNRAGKKRVVLELGGNAACVVDRDVNIDAAVKRITQGAFYQSGQSCISVQRIIAHRAIYDELREKLRRSATGLQSGDPLSEDTFLGPLISEENARRIEQWTSDAVRRGASVLVGGKRRGSFFDATILENVPHDADVSCMEAFGPVATLEPFDDFDAALEVVNDSRYGLQAGVFTRDIHRAFRAFDTLEVGGVVINDVPSMRVDSMPYGGVKDSGLGREGVPYAMEEMTELRLLVLKHDGP